MKTVVIGGANWRGVKSEWYVVDCLADSADMHRSLQNKGDGSLGVNCSHLSRWSALPGCLYCLSIAVSSCIFACEHISRVRQGPT